MVKTHVAHSETDSAVVIWLAVLIVMVFVMVILGGVTRLTHSGLSMVQWNPVAGWLPPLDEEQWQAVFAEYRRYPEYRELNVGMTLAEFKSIFWMEYVHRLWGRLIGVVFMVPFAVFLSLRRIGGRLAAGLGVLLLFGAAQGVLGWYMVQSGLVDVPDVSPYRLAAHLGLALVIYVGLLWVLLGQLPRRPSPPAAGEVTGNRRGATAAAGLVLLTALSGAFVAGLDAGFTYNTFPLMDGALVPDDLMAMSPWYLNFFENITTVQFDHRLLAVSVVVVTAWLWWRGLRRASSPRARWSLHAFLAAALVQAGLGIATLLLVVPPTLASIHQGGALVLLGIAVWAVFECRPTAAASSRRPVAGHAGN